MRRYSTLLAAFGLGMSTMYIFDPTKGLRRRAIFKDKVSHIARQTQDAMDVAVRDLVHRTQGVIASARGFFEREEVIDEVLVARVRAKIGRWVSHPHAIKVNVRRGRIILSGVLLNHEVSPLISAVRKVRGVRGVENHLEPHRADEKISSLQGGEIRRGHHQIDVFQKNWSPASRLIVGVMGGFLGMYALNQRRLSRVVLGSLALLALLRSLTNQEILNLIERNHSTKEIAA